MFENLPTPMYPFRGVNNKRLTACLFYERANELKVEERIWRPLFSLEIPREGYICARTTFVELGDPTGYKWAMKYLGDYGHWKDLLRLSWFERAVGTWREELAVKDRSEALDIIRQIANNPGDKQALAAARYLAEQTKEKPKVGRPDRSIIQGELKRAVEKLTVEDEDMKRIGLVK